MSPARGWTRRGALAGLALGGSAAIGWGRPSAAAPPARGKLGASPRIRYVAPELHVGDGTVLRAAALDVVDGKIAAVGAAGPSGDVQVVELRDRVITPGLIAADSQLGLVEIELEGSTVEQEAQRAAPIRAGFDPSLAIHADSSLLAAQLVEGITHAAATPTGGVLSGLVTWLALRPGDHRGVIARRGIAVAGGFGQRFEGSRARTIDLVVRALTDAGELRRSRAAYQRNALRPLAADALDLEALWPVLDRRIPLVLHAERASDLLAAIDLGKRFGIRLLLTGGAEAWKVADELAQAKVTVLVHPSQNLPGSFERLGARLDNAALLARAGVAVGIADFGRSHNVRNVRQEAGIAVAYGLDYPAAIAGLTGTLARGYGVDDRWGTLAVGRSASFVAWTGDPLELSSAADQVWIDGVAMPTSSRQRALRDRYLRRHGLMP